MTIPSDCSAFFYIEFFINYSTDIEIILNKETGHAMKGKGYGSMQMNINTLGKFEMYGDFQVQ
uniref:hypothetical protein n=1 Tax=Flavobacterium sp. TaxID=239 RepID=UPI00404AD00B